MKKTTIAMLALTVGIMAVSCQKETEPEIKSFEPMTINAVSEGIGTATKTELAYKYDILWSEDDQIYVTDGTANDTFTLSAGKGTTKGTFTQNGKATFTSDVKAYYPATMVQDGGLVWPATQTNDQTIPMYCSKTVSGKVEDFNFSSLGSVLQIVFNTTQAGVTLKSIEIKDGSKTMSGEFTVNNGVAEITATDNAGITLNLGEGKALGKGANYFNIAVPAGNYQDLTLVFTATDGAKCTMTKGKVNIACNTVGRLTLTGKTFKHGVPDGVLPGKFSVSNDGGTTIKQVYFSQGNLWYDGSAFKFEDTQYAFQSSWNSSLVSHFFWSKSVDEAVKEEYDWGQDVADTDVFFTNETETTSKDGFTVNVGGTEQTGWRTLSTAEWQYLFNNRTDAASKVGYATVGGVNGLIILPDSFTDPMKNNGSGAFVPKSSTGWTQNVYTSGNNWNAMETAGAVFLPAAGLRNGSSVFNVGGDGSYWSSAAIDGSLAYYVYFNSFNVCPDTNVNRRYGFSVRLITESK